MKYLLLAILLVTGCTAPVIQVPIGQAALVYADAKTAYTVLNLQIVAACKAEKIPPEACAEMMAQSRLVDVLDADVRKSILQAEGTIDWAKVMQILQVIAGLAVKVGGL